MKKKILITGVNGFIGFSLFEYLSKIKNFEVYGIGTNKKYKRKKNLNIKYTKVTTKSLLALKKVPDLIIHCAGSGSVGGSYSNKSNDYLENFRTTQDTLEYCRMKYSIKKLIFISSAAIYGNFVNLKKIKPLSPYGRNKLLAENLCIKYHKKYELDLAVLRLFSVYGDGLKKQLIWEACKKLRNNNLIFYGDGEESRSWINIKDVIRAIICVIKDKKPFLITDIAPKKQVKVKDILSIVSKNFKINSKNLSFNGIKKKGYPNHQKIILKNIFKLGWKPTVTLERGIKKYVKWFNKQ